MTAPGGGRSVLRLLCVRAVRLASAIALLGLAAGCSSRAEVPTAVRDASIYQSVINDLVDQSGVDLDDSGEMPVVFIESFEPDEMPLEVQVEVIAGFVERYEIRFIDDRDEAVEIDEAGEPVRAGSLLIGLGPIVLDGAAELRGELYLSTEEVRAYRYRLSAASDESWSVTAGSPEAIEPVGFVRAS